MTNPAAHFRDLPFMGVIRVNNEAMKVGWRMGDPAWTNLGQGQPEVGEMPGAPARFSRLEIDPGDHAYGPVEGIPEYRDAIAAHYNRLYRAGKTPFSRENVCVAPGGRAALTRIAAALGKVRLGYFTPDYTAYEDLLNTFPNVTPVWIELRASEGFRIDPKALEARIVKDRIDALLISNPCNPTGVVVRGEELRAWVEIARKHNVTLLMDEFYSHFVYGGPDSGDSVPGGPALRAGSSPAVSCAPYLDNPVTDPVVIIDGLTKCFRYPGWRSGWVIAPKAIIQRLTAAGSFLDGGASRPIQRAGIEILSPARADQETSALRTHFSAKQHITLEALRAIGVTFPAMQPGLASGTFHLWGDVSKLPGPLSTGEGFMREAFKHQVLTVPGEFFDVRPAGDASRSRDSSSLRSFVRFSFGPPMENLKAGLRRLGEMRAKF